MTYWSINALFLAIVAGVVGAALVATRRRAARGLRASAFRPAALAVTMAVLLLMTAVFDNIMIGVKLVGYDESRISGQFIGIAPVEDFAYAVAAVLLLPSLWILVGRSPSRNSRPAEKRDRS